MDIKRDYQFDNIKCIMMILVVLGHALTHLYAKGLGTFPTKYLYSAIYAFHMPMFIFIAGYFSKRTTDYGTYAKKVITGSLIPFIVFNILYGYLFADKVRAFTGFNNILHPKWTL